MQLLQEVALLREVAVSVTNYQLKAKPVGGEKTLPVGGDKMAHEAGDWANEKHGQ
ncbi:MAG: hypothetical protein KJZ86_05710 [Caldilineaceae bacterium]|nr:hypothetical protein [Caldilineaceae bacterium]HRJ40744.1 hypothetical protein [Caldilineaceae bacterium]